MWWPWLDHICVIFCEYGFYTVYIFADASLFWTPVSYCQFKLWVNSVFNNSSFRVIRIRLDINHQRQPTCMTQIIVTSVKQWLRFFRITLIYLGSLLIKCSLPSPVYVSLNIVYTDTRSQTRPKRRLFRARGVTSGSSMLEAITRPLWFEWKSSDTLCL